MSIEYSTVGEVLVDDNLFPSLAQRLDSSKEYEVLDVTEKQLLLRFRSGDRRSSWPEDVAIQKEPTGIYIAFHSATREQRYTLLEHLKELLKVHDITTDFTEL